jgi:hypothetical protein
MKNFFQKKYRLIILASLILTVALSILGASRDSLIYDEDAHIPAGYSYLTTFDMRLNPEHPPLIKDLSAFPLLFLDLNFDTTKPSWSQNPNDAQWNAGKEFLFQSGNDADQIIFWSRLPIIALFVILALFIFKWTRELAGISAGLLAFILFVFDPNILGHNHFVTTDLGIAAFITFAFYYFIHFLKNPNWKNVFLLGLFLGLVQLAKFSSVLIFPVMGVVILAYSLVKLTRHKKTTDFKFKLQTFGKLVGKFSLAFAISIIIVWVAYYFTTFNMPESKLPEIATYYFKNDDTNLKAVYSKKVIFALNESEFFRPMAVYLFGVARVFQRVAGGNVTYFLGEISTAGFFSYFPVVFLLKEPLPSLILFSLALLITIFGIFQTIRKKKNDKDINIFGNYIRTSTAELSMIIFIFIYLLTSITGRLNIGLRHLLPIFPFIYILTSASIIDFVKNIRNRKKRVISYSILITLCLILILKTIFSYPSYMSYFNEFAGGSNQGYRYVTDSNADWGQDLKRLDKFVERYNWCPQNSLDSFCAIYDPRKGKIEQIRLDYFGMASADYYLGENYTPWWKSKRPIESGWYAISTLFLQESIHDTTKKDNESYRWLEDKKPFAQVGTSILVYYVTPEEASAIK